MRIPQPFVQLPFTVDQELLAEEIGQFDDSEWRAHPQDVEGCSSLNLAFKDGGENGDVRANVKATPQLDKAPYLRQVMYAFSSVIGGSRLIKLEPGALLPRHSDVHYFGRKHLRLYVPIVSEADMRIYCGDKDVHMAPGEAWTCDNWLPQSVENRSNQTSIHLLIDTVGSSKLWRCINGRDTQQKHITFDPSVDPELTFECHDGLAIMHPEELAADLIALCSDINPNKQSTNAKDDIQLITQDFLHDWNSQWMAKGLSIEGFPAFKALRESFRRELNQLSDSVRLSSNDQLFKEAACSTLDAALVPDKLMTASPAYNQSISSKRPKFDRPIFIVAAPRSGSTLLFETMAVNREIWSIGDESHRQFESIASLRPSGKNSSNRLLADQATIEVQETLLNAFAKDLVNSDGKRYVDLSVLSRPREIRFLEKTPKNALRIPFLQKVFPDAHFIFLFRDPRQNMSSLLESWRSRSWVTYPSLPNWPKDMQWSHLLIPGWEKLTKASLAEVVAQQWLVTNQTILDDLNELPKERWTSIEYDEFLNNTPESLNRLCRFSQVVFGPRMQQLASKPLKPSKYTHTAPHPDKWRKNEAELSSVIPATQGLFEQLKNLDQ